MAITQRTLRAAASRFSQSKHPRTLSEALSKKKSTAFLCHSHKDHQLALGLQTLMSENGCDLYIDWQDTEMPETPNRETASRIKNKIKTLNIFLFLATENSTSSRWCPWEIGYADSVKGYDYLFIIPTENDYGRYYGNEYLQLYKKIDTGSHHLGKTGYAVFGPNAQTGKWIEYL